MSAAIRATSTHWAELGATGWGFADVAPYFRRMEHWHGGGAIADWRGHDGPLHVTRGPRANPLFHAFIEAGTAGGLSGATDDYNGGQQEGFGAMEATIWQGRRWSAASAYLQPALRRPNCTLVRGLARRVVIAEGRARGGRGRRGRRARRSSARAREVIIAASSINSPKLLMLSGIGPAAHLAEHGIAVVADRPGVGANLQDHLEVYMQMRRS